MRKSKQSSSINIKNNDSINNGTTKIKIRTDVKKQQTSSNKNNKQNRGSQQTRASLSKIKLSPILALNSCAIGINQLENTTSASPATSSSTSSSTLTLARPSFLKLIQKSSSTFYYYISQIERDLRNKIQQNQSLFISHFMLTMSIQKMHRYLYIPVSPSIKVDQQPNTYKYTQTHNNIDGEYQDIVGSSSIGVGHRKLKQLSFNLSNNNKKQSNKIVVIFDLDQTLVHSIDITNMSTEQQNSLKYSHQHKIVVKCQRNYENTAIQMSKNIEGSQQQDYGKLQDKLTKYLPTNSSYNYNTNTQLGTTKKFIVNFRPNLLSFLARLSKHYTLGIFTAAQKSYAQAILSLIDPHQKLFSFKLFRNHCTPLTQSQQPTIQGMIKDLRINPNYNPSKTIIIDNSSISYLFQKQNGIPIIPFTKDQQDDQLLKFQHFLNVYLKDCEDVRPVLREYFRIEDYVRFGSVKEIMQRIFKMKR